MSSIIDRPPPPRCPVTDIARRFDPFDGEPDRIYPVLAAARASEPVFYSPEIDYWVLTRYDDVKAALEGDPSVFSAANALELVTPLCPAALAIAQEHRVALSPSIVDEDPPLHTTHRRSMHKPFSRGRIMALEPLVRELVTARLDAVEGRGEMDLVGEVLLAVPAYVLFELFGVPRSELANVRQFVQRLAILGFGRPDEQTQVTMTTGLAQFLDFCRGHVRRLIEHPGDNAISEFIANLTDPATGELPDPEYVATVTFQLFFAGHETTINATAGGVRALLEHRTQWEALCADASLIPNAVEECLRYAPSVPAWRRVLLKPMTIGGVELPAGARLLVGIGSANRDDAHFEHGEQFDIFRGNAREHLGFGFGRHHCLGHELARMEMRVILEELTRRLPGLELVPGQVYPYSANTSHRGPEHVHVRWPVTR